MPSHAVTRGFGAPMSAITLIAITLVRQPDLKTSLEFALFLGIGGAVGILLASRLDAVEAQPLSPRQQSGLVLAAFGVALIILALAVDPSAYLRFTLLLTTGVVLLTGSGSSEGVGGIAGQRLWGTLIGAGLAAIAILIAVRVVQPDVQQHES
ncbi:MAG: FUSC family protein [Microthrixaceae bacterium]